MTEADIAIGSRFTDLLLPALAESIKITKPKPVYMFPKKRKRGKRRNK